MKNTNIIGISILIIAMLSAASIAQYNRSSTGSADTQTNSLTGTNVNTGGGVNTGDTGMNDSQTTNTQTDVNMQSTTNSPITRRSDSEIIADIRTQLTNDKSISGQRVDVSSENGVVTLRGNVDTDTQASTIIQIASSVLGVTDINTTYLKVRKSIQPFTDMVITAKIRGAYIREKVFGDREVSAMGVSIETINGVVYLTGKVDTQQQAVNAAAIARSISGVKSVNSRINVGTANQ